MKLGKIAKVNTGLLVSRKKNRYSDREGYDYKLLNVNSLDKFGNIDLEKLDDFNSSEVLDSRYLTKIGRIVLRLNSPYTSTYIDTEEKENIIISNLFIEIEIKDKNYLPEYIDWYLHTDFARINFLKNQSGTLISTVNQKIVKQLDIPEKSLSDQKKIIELFRLHKEKMGLLYELQKEEEEYYRGISEKFIDKK